jgi:succinate dehydrogenase/fumarate reductase cytochrome b subunit
MVWERTKMSVLEAASAAPANTRWRRWHKISALILFAFIIAHIFNHLSGFYGIETYNSVQKILRRVYRFPPVEIFLLLLISWQSILGLTLLIQSLRRGRPKGFWAWTQILSGGFFFVFIVEHLIALLMARLVFRLDTNFYWPASVMSGPPYTYYFIPYYFLGIFALLTHIGIGLRYWAIDAGRPVLGNGIGIGFMLMGAVIGAAIIPILTGALFQIPLSEEWLNYLRYFLPDYTPPVR